MRIFSSFSLILILAAAPVLKAQSRIDFNLESIRDPFILPTAVEEIEEKDEDILKRLPFTIDIKGIVIDETGKFVIINDMIVKEKGNWKSLVIDEIEKDHLIVIYGERKIRIPFKEKEVQK